MTSTENARPRDCLSCRIVGAVGMVGIGGYLANAACKNKSLPGKYGLSVLSFGINCVRLARSSSTQDKSKTFILLTYRTWCGYRFMHHFSPQINVFSFCFLFLGFICLGVARYKQTFPFNKNEEFKTRM